MILVVCTACGTALRVEGEDQEIESLVGSRSDWWPDRYPCPTCLAHAEVLRDVQISAEAARGLNVTHTTPQEAFAAFSGLGLPKERSAHLLDVADLLREKRVKRVVGRDVLGTTRCVIDYLELEDGSRIYWGPSSEGATVYRVTRPHSYVKALEEEHG